MSTAMARTANFKNTLTITNDEIRPITSPADADVIELKVESRRPLTKQVNINVLVSNGATRLMWPL